MVTIRSKTGSLPASTKVIPPIEDDVVKKPAKRVQVARVNTIRQESKLLQLPVEILQEILSQADLIDLLSWSYCCRDLNDWLTSKRSQQIWTAATDKTRLYRHTYSYTYNHYRRNRHCITGKEAIELPICPPSMPPFHHAKVLFDHQCVDCGRDGPYLEYCIKLSALVKICDKCRTKNLVTKTHLKSLWVHEDLPPNFWTAIPAQIQTHWNHDGAPAPNKLAYDLETAEAFLSKYRAYELQVGFDEAAIGAFLDSIQNQQLEWCAILKGLGSWLWQYQCARKVIQEEEKERLRRQQVVLNEVNRLNVVKRTLAEEGHLHESDVNGAIDSLAFLDKLDHLFTDSDWQRVRTSIFKASNTLAMARAQVISIFNPVAIAFRKMLRPHWNACIALFSEADTDSEDIVIPTLYEFSMLPALANLRAKYSARLTSDDEEVPKDDEGFAKEITKLQESFQADLSTYSQSMLGQLSSKLGGKRGKQSDIIARLHHPTVIFHCDMCRQSYDGTKILRTAHKCTETTAISNLKFATLGDYYVSEEFKQEYLSETDMESWDVDEFLEKIPVRSLEKVRLDKDRISDVSRILSLCDSCNIEIEQPVTTKTLEAATKNLIFVCEVCERYEDMEEELDGRHKGVEALLDHLEDTRKRTYRWEHIRDEADRVMLHGRIRIEGKTSNKRNARKAVKYTEAEDE